MRTDKAGKPLPSPAITSPKKVVSDNEDEEAVGGASEGSGDEEQGEYENQYTLIYPSARNTENEYDKYLAYATKCYERFTGSYSKESRDAAAAKIKQEQEVKTGGIRAAAMWSKSPQKP